MPACGPGLASGINSTIWVLKGAQQSLASEVREFAPLRSAPAAPAVAPAVAPAPQRHAMPQTYREWPQRPAA